MIRVRHQPGIPCVSNAASKNGPVEGIDNKLRVITRRAYGFHSHGPLISMLYLCCGGIELAPPPLPMNSRRLCFLLFLP